MRLLVLFEKHYTRYFAVQTDRQLHKVCVKILKERFADGWYNPGEKPEELKLPEWTKTLPNGRFKNGFLKLLEENKVILQDWVHANEFKEKVIQAIKQPFPKNGKAQLVRTEIGNGVPILKSFSLLSSRRKFEYERVELDETEN